MERTSYTMLDRLRIPKINNPGQMRIARIQVDGEKCRECGTCVSVCVYGCLETDRLKKKDFMDGTAKGGKFGMPRLENISRGANYCFACNCCGAACPHDAITVVRNYSPGFRFKRLTQTGRLTYPKPY